MTMHSLLCVTQAAAEVQASTTIYLQNDLSLQVCCWVYSFVAEAVMGFTRCVSLLP